MEGIKLPSSSEFGKVVKERLKDDWDNLRTGMEYFRLRDGFDSFLDESLELGQFVACVGGRPIKSYIKDGLIHYDGVDPDELKEAQSKVIFEGFEFRELPKNYYIQNTESMRNISINKESGKFSINTIEEIVRIGINLTTLKAIELGLIK